MKKVITCAFFVVLAVAAHAQKVDVEELQSDRTVEFINFEGAQPSTSPEAIRNIGADMARQLLSGRIKGEWADKYMVVHLFDKAESDMLGADVLALGENARVNHINSLRLIMSGFLEDYYAYSRSDADVLSFFVTVYNAIYRGDLGYFLEKYQNVVMDMVDPTKTGLGLDYREWPGNSEILVPLTDRAERQDIRSLDTSILTDPRVTAAVRAQPDRGLEERKGVVDIKEREVAATEAEIEENRVKVSTAEETLADSETELAAKGAEVTRQEEKLAEERKELEAETDEEEKARKEAELKEKEETLEAEKAARDELEQEVESHLEEIQAGKERIAEAEEAVEEKLAEIDRDRETIARDERLAEVEKAIEEEPEKVAEQLVAMEEEAKSIPRKEPIVAGKLYYLKVKQYLTDGHYDNDLYIIDALSGEYILKAADKPHIAGHKYDVVPGAGVLVLTHGGGKEAHFLTLLDLDTLEVLTTGSVDIYHLSFVERRGDYVYTVNYRGANDFHLGKYSAVTLRLLSESDVKIDGNTVFHMSGNLIFVNGEKGEMLVIDADTLEVANTIRLP